MKEVDWRKISSIAEILSSVAILVTLVFLTLQLQQNTNAMRSQTYQGIANIAIETLSLSVTDDDLRKAFIQYYKGGPESLSEDQSWQLIQFTSLAIRVQQERFVQSRLGFISEEELTSPGGTQTYFNTPLFLDWWSNARINYTAEFQEYVDEVLIPSAGEIMATDMLD